MEVKRIAPRDIGATLGVQQNGLVGAAEFIEFGILHGHVAVVHEHHVAALVDGHGLAVAQVITVVGLGPDPDVAGIVGNRNLEVVTAEIVGR